MKLLVQFSKITVSCFVILGYHCRRGLHRLRVDHLHGGPHALGDEVADHGRQVAHLHAVGQPGSHGSNAVKTIDFQLFGEFKRLAFAQPMWFNLWLDNEYCAARRIDMWRQKFSYHRHIRHTRAPCALCSREPIPKSRDGGDARLGHDRLSIPSSLKFIFSRRVCRCWARSVSTLDGFLSLGCLRMSPDATDV